LSPPFTLVGLLAAESKFQHLDLDLSLNDNKIVKRNVKVNIKKTKDYIKLFKFGKKRFGGD
jgi:hypothetical protein